MALRALLKFRHVGANNHRGVSGLVKPADPGKRTVKRQRVARAEGLMMSGGRGGDRTPDLTDVNRAL